jgi:hypothetical protein
MKHPHAEIMKAYADDCTLQIQVKENWGWVDLNEPKFYKDSEYRIKPEEVKMIRVGRHEWEEPLKDVPTVGAVWSFSFEYHSLQEIVNLCLMRKAISEGVAHRTKEAAQQHREAMQCISRGDIE